MYSINDNLKLAIEMLLFMSDQQLFSEDVPKAIKKKNWFQKYTWTERRQEQYIDWFVNFLKTNWEGILDHKPDKKERIKATDNFILNYGLKIRPLVMDDFMPVVSFEQLKAVMGKSELERFNKFMLGQTTALYGVYRSDLGRWLSGLPNID